MIGFSKLNNDTFLALFHQRELHRFTLNEIEYFYQLDANPNNSRCYLIASPINLHVHTLKDLITQFSQFLQDNGQVLVGLVGDGLTPGGQHIIATHIFMVKGQLYINFYDPKISSVKHFFPANPLLRDSKWQNFKNKASQLTQAMITAVKALLPQKPLSLSGKTNFLDLEPAIINYHSLHVQSFFDDTTCGYYTYALLTACQNIILSGQTVNKQRLLQQLHSPVKTGQQILNAVSSNKIATNWRAFIYQAWLDIFMPLENKQSPAFKYYFMKWPKHTKGQLVYLFTLSFITYPFINLLKALTEFPLNLLTATANFFKHQCMAIPAKNGLTQTLRSVLLLFSVVAYGGFKSSFLIMRTVTSPITSVQSALALSPYDSFYPLRFLLAGLSALTSIALYTTLLVIIAPVIISLLPLSTLSFIAPIITTLAYPLTYLGALISVNIAPISGALISLLALASLTFGFTHLSRWLAKTTSSVKSSTKAPIDDIDEFVEINAPTHQSTATIIKRFNCHLSEEDLILTPEDFGMPLKQDSSSVVNSEGFFAKKSLAGAENLPSTVEAFSKQNNL